MKDGWKGTLRRTSSSQITAIPRAITPKEERFIYCNWLKHNKKLLNAGEMKENRVALFEKLLELRERYRSKNQYEWPGFNLFWVQLCELVIVCVFEELVSFSPSLPAWPAISFIICL